MIDNCRDVSVGADAPDSVSREQYEREGYLTGLLVLEPGEASIHYGLLIHGSGRNRSNRRRCGLTVRFVPTCVRQVRRNGKGKMWPALLVRGEDRFGHFPKRERPFI